MFHIVTKDNHDRYIENNNQQFILFPIFII